MTRLRALIGATLRRHRHAQQRTLREVADDAGISLTYLSEIERGRKEASSEVLAALCDALGVMPSTLLREVADRLALLETAEAARAAARARTPVGFLPYRPQTPATPAANGTTDHTAQASQTRPSRSDGGTTGTDRPVAKAEVIPLHEPLHEATPGDFDEVDEALLEVIDDLLLAGTHPDRPDRDLLPRPRRPHRPHDGGARILDFQAHRAHRRSRSA